MAKDTPSLTSLVMAGEGTSTAEQISDGIYMSPGISNAYLVLTNEGNVAINAGMNFEGPQHKSRFSEVSDAPLKVLIFTQSHGDHIGGTSALLEPDTQIIGQADYYRVRGYWNRLAPFYGRRTQILWASVLGKQSDRPKQPPDPIPTLLFKDSHSFALGERQFELIATPGGETTDSLIVWLPKEGAVFVGNLFGPIFGHLPNLYTIRGDKIRSALSFIECVNKVLDLDAELLISGHGQPVHGKDEIRRQLTQIRDATQWIHDRTVDGMNEGKSLNTLMTEIQLPADLAVGQGHGKLSWCVRAIWEEYAGWFHCHSTTELYPASKADINADIVALAGAAALTQKANEYISKHRPVEALHLTDMVLELDPTAQAALSVRAAALEQLLEQAAGENFSEVQWLRGRLEETQALIASASK